MAEVLDQALRRGITSWSFALRRWEDAEVRRFVGVLQQEEARLVKLLGQRLTAAKRARSRELARQVRDLLIAAERRLVEQSGARVIAAAGYETARFEARLVASLLPAKAAGVLSALPSPAVVQAAVQSRKLIGSTFVVGRFSESARGTYQKILSTIVKGILSNAANGEIVAEVRAQFGLHRKGAEAYVRTAAAHAASMARSELYGTLTDVIAEELWVSTLDEVTTEVCQGLDGERFPVGEGPHPPAHWNCRSDRVPITKSWEEILGPGAGRIKSPGAEDFQRGAVGDAGVHLVSGRETYSTWIRKQPREFQDRVMGSARAQIMRDNPGMKLSALLDARTYQPLTLAELREVGGLIIRGRA